MKQTGTGMIDTLVALLLLAFSLLGACTLLTRTLAASRGATVQTIAVDLASDLAEDLVSENLRARSPIARDETVRAWQLRVADILPVGVPPLDHFASLTPPTISLRWVGPFASPPHPP